MPKLGSAIRSYVDSRSDEDGKDTKFFEIISPKTLIIRTVWCGIIAAAVFVLSKWIYDTLSRRSDVSAIAAALTAFLVVVVYAGILIKKVMDRFKFIIKEDREIIRNIVGGTMITCDDDFFTIKKCTPMFYDMLGYKRGEILERYRREFDKMLVGDESRLEFAKLKHKLHESGHAQARYKLLKGDGSELWVAVRSFLVKGIGRDPSVYTVLLDISREMNLQRRYMLAEARNKIVLENINSGIFEWDLMRNTLEISDQMERRFFGREADGVLPAAIVKDYIDAEDFRLLSEKIESMRNNGTDKIEMTLKLKNVDGSYTHSDVSLIAVRDNNNVAVRAVGILIDVEERHQREEKLRGEASRDSLTGIYNKGATQKLIESAIELRPEQEHALILFDVDNFKSVNDTFGHGVGDETIKKVADLLGDTFCRGSIAGRIGGDEFMVFCRGIGGDYGRLRMLLDRIKENKPVIGEGEKRREITLSAGVALYRKDGATYDELYKNADIALYKAKNSGKNRYEFYSDL